MKSRHYEYNSKIIEMDLCDGYRCGDLRIISKRKSSKERAQQAFQAGAQRWLEITLQR